MVCIKIPKLYLQGIDALIERGLFNSRSEAIRVAVRDLLRRELWRLLQAARDDTTAVAPRGVARLES